MGSSVGSSGLLHEDVWLLSEGGVGIPRYKVGEGGFGYGRGQIFIESLIEPEETIAGSQCLKLVCDDGLKRGADYCAGSVLLGQASHEQIEFRYVAIDGLEVSLQDRVGGEVGERTVGCQPEGSSCLIESPETYVAFTSNVDGDQIHLIYSATDQASK